MQSRTSMVCALAGAVLAAATHAHAETDPTIISWLQNIAGLTGHSPAANINTTVSQIQADVQQVRYTATDVYVNATDVPDHNVGPFGNNPNIPADQHKLVRVPRQPVAAATKTATGLGSI